MLCLNHVSNSLTLSGTSCIMLATLISCEQYMFKSLLFRYYTYQTVFSTILRSRKLLFSSTSNFGLVCASDTVKNQRKMETCDIVGETNSMCCVTVQCSIGRDKIGSSLWRRGKHKSSSEIDTCDTKKVKLETKALKEKRPGFTDDRYNETSYYLENGLRKVYPYHFTFTTFTKGRWVGQKILDVFVKEFRSHPAEEYEKSIRDGSLTVNCKKVDVDYCLKHNELLSNTVHRHEVPVTAEPITIVHADKDLVVVNKPASIPVHPCGRYRHNTVVFILAKEYGMRGLRTIHRLDRLTSGLLLFGRSPERTKTMEQQIRNRQVQKEYVCRVEGEFPSSQVDCHEPIHVVSFKIGVSKVHPNGKQCYTTFQRLSYNGKTSVVLAKPHTGRMHQIRVHLQYLGYPIVNDPLYNHTVFGPSKGRGGDFGGKSDEDLIRDLISIHNAENWLGVLDGEVEVRIVEKPVIEEPPTKTPEIEEKNEMKNEKNPSNVNCRISESSRDTKEGRVTVATQTAEEEEVEFETNFIPKPLETFDPSLMSHDPNCHECKVSYRDPKPRDLVMYLHAWKYKGPDWSFETELPKWASSDWAECED